MIFSNKIYKISSGTNVSLNAVSDTQIELYVFLKNISKYLLEFGSTLRSSLSENNISYNYVCEIGDGYMCVCFDDNMSVIYE